MTSTAAMASANSKGALAFDDEEVAAETLSALAAKPLVLAGCLYREDRKLFAAYQRPESGSACPAVVPTPVPALFLARRLTTTQVIAHQTRALGTLSSSPTCSRCATACAGTWGWRRSSSWSAVLPSC